jgi:hypothetical protein
VTLIVFVPADGTPDIIARLIGKSLSQRLGQSVVIDKDHERRRERMPEVQGAGHQVAQSHRKWH